MIVQLKLEFRREIVGKHPWINFQYLVVGRNNISSSKNLVYIERKIKWFITDLMLRRYRSSNEIFPLSNDLTNLSIFAPRTRAAS